MTVLKAVLVQEMLDHGYPFPAQITFWTRFLGAIAFGMGFVLCVVVDAIGWSWSGSSSVVRSGRDREFAEKQGWSLYFGNVEMLQLATFLGVGMSAREVLWVGMSASVVLWVGVIFNQSMVLWVGGKMGMKIICHSDLVFCFFYSCSS